LKHEIDIERQAAKKRMHKKNAHTKTTPAFFSCFQYINKLMCREFQVQPNDAAYKSFMLGERFAFKGCAVFIFWAL
jgi:hypothetical protein